MMRSSLITVLLLTLVVVSACSDGDSGVTTSQPACADPADCRLWEAGQVAGVRVGLAGEYPEGKRREIVLAEGNISVPNCTDILIYGVEDEERFWGPLPYDDPAPLLFDKAFAPKPAYFAVRDALLAGRP